MDDFDRITQEAWGNTPLEEMYSLMDVTEFVWVCEHEPEPEVAGLMPCRVLDSVTTDKIMIVDGNG